MNCSRPRMGVNVFSCCFVAVLAVCLLEKVSGQRPPEFMKCYQCNVFSKGKQQICSKEENTPEALIVDNCIACLKTFTFTSIHDRWFNQESLTHRFRRSMTYKSKYCLTELDSDLVKDEGCYQKKGPNGFTRQCYCYTELCNSSSRLVFSYITSVIAVLYLTIPAFL